MSVKAFSQTRVLMGKLPYESDIFEEVAKIAKENNVKSGSVSIIGAVKSVKLGFYKQQEKEYIEIEGINEFAPFEIASCSGNISLRDGIPVPHLHIIVTDKSGKAFGGHLLPGTVVFAGEFVINVFDGAEFHREKDDVTGLPLWID